MKQLENSNTALRSELELFKKTSLTKKVTKYIDVISNFLEKSTCSMIQLSMVLNSIYIFLY